jgi:TolA-binding protein
MGLPIGPRKFCYSLKSFFNGNTFTLIMRTPGLVLLLLAVASLCFAATEGELLAEAEGYYRAGNYLLALDSYAEFIARYPLSDRVADAQYRRGVCLFRLGRFRESLAVFSEVEKRYRSTRFFDYIYFWQGVAFFRLEEYPRATEALDRFLGSARDPELTPQAYLYKGQAELALQDYSEASRSLEALVKGFRDSDYGELGLVLLLYSYLGEGRYAEAQALAAATDARSIGEKRRELFSLYAAEAYWKGGQPEKAEPLYAPLLDARDDIAAVAYRRLYMAAAERNDLSRMEELVRQAEQRFSGSPALLEDLWVQVGIESYRQQKYDLASYFLEKVWEQPGKEQLGQAVPLYLAELRLRNGEPEQAAAVLEEYLELQPQGADLALLRLADVRLAQSDLSTARSQYTQLMERYPDSPYYRDAGYMLAYVQYRQGETAAALELATRLLESQPPDPLRKDLYRLCIVLHKKKGNTTEALSLLRSYVSLYPEDLRARIDLLKLLFGMQDYAGIVSESTRLFQDAPDLQARDPYVFLLSSYLRGLSEISRKRYKSAISSLKPIAEGELQSAGLSAIWPYTLYYLGWAYYRDNQYGEARERALRLLEGFPAHPLFAQTLFLVGWSAFSQGDFQAAASYFGRLAKTTSADADKAAFLQARSLTNLGNLGEAAVLFKNLYTSRPGSDFADDALFEHAGILAQLKQIPESVAAYAELARRYPQSPLAEEALYKRGEVYRSAGRYAEARDAFYEYRSRYPKGRLVDASLYWGGLASYELGESSGAVLHWERLIDNYAESPFRPDALRRTAELYAGRGDYRKALQLYTTLVQQYPDEAKVYQVPQKMDELRYQQQGLSDREAVLSSIIGQEGGAKTAKGREAMIELARLYIYEGSGRMELAYEMLRSVVDKGEPQTAAQAQFLIGEYRYRKSDPVGAAQEFLKAAYLDTRDRDLMAAAIYRAAEMMQLAGRNADLQELVARLEQHFPDSEWTLEAKKLLEGGRP